MVTDYQSRKNEVLDSCATVEELVEALRENAKQIGDKMPDPLKTHEQRLADIRSKAEKVRADRFCIMIAGESKSGKSTFINAYLGEELLPMDVKQCTSAIVRIKYGETFCVRATYADEEENEITGATAAREFLRKNAALNDEYRNIPVPTINSEILVKSGQRAKKKGAQISISDKEVDELLAAEEVQEANIYGMSTEEYNQKIREYIKNTQDDWHNIVTEIEVSFPFSSEEMRGIEIIDSPGVCARGGVAEITKNYIQEANAIIFLKPLIGQALEATQFNHFMRNTSVERNKNTLFLVLTRAADVVSEDLEKLEKEAYKQFGNLDKEKIFLVDSKAQLYVKRFSGVDDIQAELRKLHDAKTLDDFVVTAYNTTSGLFGEGDTSDFIRALQEMSRFEQVYEALETFGRQSHYILLRDLLCSINKLYDGLWNDLNTQMELFREKAEDSTELGKKIDRIEKELEEIKRKMYDGVEAVVRRFRADGDGIIMTKVNNAAADFSKMAKKIDRSSKDAFRNLEYLSMHKIDEFEALTKELQEAVVEACDHELVELSDKSAIPFEAVKPDFTEATFAEIRDATKEKAKEVQTFETGVTFKKTHNYSEYSQYKHFGIILTNIEGRLKTITNDIIGYLSDFTEEIGKRYKEELKKNDNAKKEERRAIQEKQATAEQIAVIITKLGQLNSRIDSAKSDAAKIKGGIDKHVQCNN